MAEYETEDGVVSVGDGVKLSGEIHAREVVIVDGAFNGEISCKRLVVGQTGVVDGRISVMEADVYGKVTGDIVARQSLVARSTARIEGTWLVGEIVAERGAILNGVSGDAAQRAESRAVAVALETPAAPAPAAPTMLRPSARLAAAAEKRVAAAGR